MDLNRLSPVALAFVVADLYDQRDSSDLFTRDMLDADIREVADALVTNIGKEGAQACINRAAANYSRIAQAILEGWK